MRISKLIAGAVIGLIGLTLSCTTDGDNDKDRTTIAQPLIGNGKKDPFDQPSPAVLGPNTLLPTSASFSPDGKRIVVAFTQKHGVYRGPKWKMWDVETGKEVKTNWPNFDVKKTYPSVYFISYLPDGKRILTMEFPNICRIWDAETIEVLRVFPLEAELGAVFTADGAKFLMVGKGKNPTSLRDVETGKPIQQLDMKQHVYPVQLSPNARWAIGTSGLGDVAYYDLKNNKTIFSAKGSSEKSNAEKLEPFLRPMLFSPDSKTVLASKIKGKTHSGVAVCDAETLKVVKEIPDVTRVLVAAFTPDGEKLLIHDVSHPERLRCWDVKSAQLLWTIAKIVEPRELKLIVPSPKGDLILLMSNSVAGGQDNREPRMVLISSKTGQVVSRFDAAVFPHSNFADPNAEK